MTTAMTTAFGLLAPAALLPGHSITPPCRPRFAQQFLDAFAEASAFAHNAGLPASFEVHAPFRSAARGKELIR